MGAEVATRVFVVTLLLLIVASAVVYVNHTRSKRAAEARIDHDAEPLAEFQRLLPKIAGGELNDEVVLGEFENLLMDVSVRRWIAKNFVGVSEDERFTLMAIVGNSAQEHRFKEFGPLIERALRDETSVGIMSCKALRYYDLPNRQELLRTLIDLDGEDNQYHIQCALRIYLELYDPREITDALNMAALLCPCPPSSLASASV